MKIIRLRIKKLYGYLDKDIPFNEDLSLLVGINGSGKTSILNIISWILKPSLPHLCLTEFSNIEMVLTFKNVTYTIKCEHKKNQLVYNLTADNNEEFDPLVVNLSQQSNFSNDIDYRNTHLFEYYSQLTPSDEEKKTMETVASFPNPIIIGLDRILYTEEAGDFYVERTARGMIRAKGPNQNNATPLERIKTLVNRDYRKQRNSILNLTKRLKNTLMLSTFEDQFTFETVTSPPNLKLSEIETVEKKIHKYFEQFEAEFINSESQKKINSYFTNLKRILKNKSSNDNREKVLYAINASQFSKVKKLLKEFNNFETASNKILEKITTYLTTLNHFFKDSSKSLTFNEETSELVFNTLDKDDQVLIKHKDVKYLSSGEQQLLILFSSIAFNNSDNKIFIIDEPELSLHIKWQEDFLESLSRITPPSTQLIIATHSPILANKRKDKAIVLLPYNN